ncbi:laccase-12 [Cryptomeria japonica]|uniref:laccase-12 n=1 Tax=Cryptomeria japonica TaxID=3369 RepID=UPI0027DA0A38|nr:laccase-12 [Cryptomeria japonica]
MADFSGFNQSCQEKLPLVIACMAFLIATAMASKIHTHTFVIQSKTVTKLCATHNIITVNGQLPGPTLYVSNGDTLIVKVFNKAQHNATIHWHGIRQLRTAWADGPEYITQCPIQPGGNYTYRFTITGQQGTLWWHAHSSWLRATVYGALIISPTQGESYPFSKPDQEIPILLGEWWNANPIDVINEATRTGGGPNNSDAFTINGHPGDLYPCSASDTFRVAVKTGQTNLLRVINGALNTDLFVTLANHEMTVVAVDALYTKPHKTQVIMLGPGQTTDVLVNFTKTAGRFYLAARAYASGQGISFDNTTATAIFEYSKGSLSTSVTPKLPKLPMYNDTKTVIKFEKSLRSLASVDHPVSVPQKVDENLFYTVGLGLINCPNQSCAGPNGARFAASMNNHSFVLPKSMSILQAHHFGIKGVFTKGFPDNPPLQFDYTSKNISTGLWFTEKSTTVKVLKYNTAVQVIIQGTGILVAESHPIHLHGYDFYIVGSGFGNYNEEKDSKKFNLVDPLKRNTVNIPVNGWAAIRFVADNPGTWLFHCHLDLHIGWGLAMVFVVPDGPDYVSTLEKPPSDLPKC